MKTIRRTSAALVALLLGAVATPAEARPARCFTTDDGHYPCDFRPTGNDGSFEIRADGRPTYALAIDRPGFAYGFVTIGARSIPLPGIYERSADDGACWENAGTATRICVW